MQRRTPALALAAALALGTLAACGSSGSDSAKDTTTTPAAAKTTTTAAAGPLEILVSNDDGYSAEGIDKLVTGLETLDNVKVTVVAPLTQQSGTGGKSTDGDLKVTDVKTISGHEAKAVEGFPSDSVRVAMDDEGLKPDLVITGINSGQNIASSVDFSGTIGAARAAVARGVPALATSQGIGTTFDYDAAIPFILDWVKKNRADIESGDAKVQVTNMNFPSCKPPSKIRGQLDVEVGTSMEGAIANQDCASTKPESELTDDISALNNGFVTISTVPDTPAS
ncbi:5'/3'-nucleotidase SurE [Aquihabitans sp. McL0605]|uniref:5'/3'-nucleotidase SurE n=1 Tax=Aquihabitans sp. McL0605 TaxID=3415671 RepID=UPI003CFA0C15